MTVLDRARTGPQDEPGAPVGGPPDRRAPHSSSGAVRLVAGREVRAALRRRSFWVGAGITLLIVLGVSIVPGLVADDGATTRTVGLTGATEELRGPLGAIDRSDPDLRIEITAYADDAEARRAAREGEVDAAVVGDRLLVEDEASAELVAVLDQAARAARVGTGVAEGTVDPDIAEALAAPQVLTVEALDPDDPDEEARQAMTVFGMFLLLAQIFAFGYAVAGGIVEEKSSRVVEVLLAKLRPGELLAGKILGIWLLTTAQILVFAALGVVGATASGTLDLPPGWLGVIGVLFLWYAVAYLFYACVFAICGALAASPEDLQSSTTPATILIMVGYAAAIAALGDPESTVTAVASFLPSSAPLVMPLRAALGDVPGWQVALSVALTLGVGALLVPVAGRVYRGSVLQTRQTKLRSAWRSART